MAGAPADCAVRIVAEFAEDCHVSSLFKKVWVLLPAHLQTVAQLSAYLAHTYLHEDVRSSAEVLLEIGGIPIAPHEDIAIIRDSDVVRVTLHPQLLAIEAPAPRLAIKGPADDGNKEKRKKKKRKEGTEENGTGEGLDEGLEEGLVGGLNRGLREGLGSEVKGTWPDVEEGKKRKKKRRAEEAGGSEELTRVDAKPVAGNAGPLPVSAEPVRVDVERLAIKSEGTAKGRKRKACGTDENEEGGTGVENDVAGADVAQGDVARDDVAGGRKKKRRKERGNETGEPQEARGLKELEGAQNAVKAEILGGLQPRTSTKGGAQNVKKQVKGGTESRTRGLGTVEADDRADVPVEDGVGRDMEAAKKEESSTGSESAGEAPKKEKKTPSRSARRKATKRRYARLAREAALGGGPENVTSNRAEPPTSETAAPALTPEAKEPSLYVEDAAVVANGPVTTQHMHFSDSDEEGDAQAARRSRQPPIILNVGRGASGQPLSKERGKEWGLQKGRKKDRYREQRGGENGWAQVPPLERNPLGGRNPLPLAETGQGGRCDSAGGGTSGEKNPPPEGVTGRDGLGGYAREGQLERKKTEAEYEQMPELERAPQVADVLAYRLVELTSSWTPQISDYREGRVVSYDASTGTITLAWWPPDDLRARKQAAVQLDVGETEETPEAEPALAPPYDGDGNLETDLASLMGVKLVQASELTLAQLPIAPPFPATAPTSPAPEKSPSSVLAIGGHPDKGGVERLAESAKQGTEAGERLEWGEVKGRETAEQQAEAGGWAETGGSNQNRLEVDPKEGALKETGNGQIKELDRGVDEGDISTGMEVDLKDTVVMVVGTEGIKELERGESGDNGGSRMVPGAAAGLLSDDVAKEQAGHSLSTADVSNASAAAVIVNPRVEELATWNGQVIRETLHREETVRQLVVGEPLDMEQAGAKAHVAPSGGRTGVGLVGNSKGEAGTGEGTSEKAEPVEQDSGAGVRGISGKRGAAPRPAAAAGVGVLGVKGSAAAARPAAWQQWERVAHLLARRRAEIAEEARLREELKKKEEEDRQRVKELDMREGLQMGERGTHELAAGEKDEEALAMRGEEEKARQRVEELAVGGKGAGLRENGGELVRGVVAGEAAQHQTRNGRKAEEEKKESGGRTPNGKLEGSASERIGPFGTGAQKAGIEAGKGNRQEPLIGAMDEKRGSEMLDPAMKDNLENVEEMGVGIMQEAETGVTEMEGPLESGAARTRALTSAHTEQLTSPHKEHPYKIDSGPFFSSQQGDVDGPQNEGPQTGHVSSKGNGTADKLPGVPRKKASPEKDGNRVNAHAVTKPRGPRLGALGPTLAYLRAQKNQLS